MKRALLFACVSLLLVAGNTWSHPASVFGSGAGIRAASFTVNSTADGYDAAPGDGVCETAVGSGVCTLRAAVEEANTLSGADSIILPAGIYILSLGQLPITADVAVSGSGSGTTTISGNGNTVFNLSTAGINVSISGVTIQNGQMGVGVTGCGGGSLSIADSVVTANSYSGVRTTCNGAYTLDITRSSIISNNDGGLIVNSGALNLTDSSVSFNTNGEGVNVTGTAVITGTTINGNTPGTYGSGTGVAYSGSLTMTNSTSSGNSGHGVFGYGGANLNNVTVTGSGFYGVDGTFNVRNSILAGNAWGDCFYNVMSQGYNLIQNDSCSMGGITTGNIYGQDPHLGPLQDNGGPTFTQALLSSSPAIDSGNPGGCKDQNGVLLTTDQRGLNRHVDGDSNGSAICDMGAYEVQKECPTITLLPTTLAIAAVGIPYSQTIIPNGGTSPYTFAVTSGSLPSWMTLNPATGVLSGLPDATGSSSFTITATDASGCMGNRSYAVTVGTCLFCDDFSDGDYTNPQWTPKGHGSWSVISQNVVGTATKKGDLISPAFTCTQCTFEAHMSVGAMGRVSMFAWYVDGKNSVEVRLMQDKQKIFVKQKNGLLAAKRKAGMTVNTDQFYDVRISFDGVGFQVSVDGMAIPALSFSAVAAPSGKADFRVKSTTGLAVSGSMADIFVY